MITIKEAIEIIRDSYKNIDPKEAFTMDGNVIILAPKKNAPKHVATDSYYCVNGKTKEITFVTPFSLDFDKFMKARASGLVTF